MAHGYPDFTYRGDVDIIAQTIGNLAVDIAAQTLATLAVDIKAQTLSEIAVDIAVQTLATLDINITSQDLAEVVIKIAAQTVGVYVERDWAATQDKDVSLTGSGTYGSSPYNVIAYTVPAGKVLYIDGMACSGDVAALWTLIIGGTPLFHVNLPTNGYFEYVFTTPKKAVAAEYIQLQATFTPNLVASGNLGCRMYTA